MQPMLMPEAPPLDSPPPLTLLLVCDDDPRLSALIQQLRAQGALVAWSSSSDRALHWLNTLTPDLMLVSPEKRGELGSALSASTKVLSWDGKADHLAAQMAPYLPLPPESEGWQRYGCLEINAKSGWIQCPREGGEPLRVHVPATELRLLLCLARQHGRAVSRSDLVDVLWPASTSPQARSVDQVVRRLRPLLAEIGLAAALRSLRGLGYRLDLAKPDQPLV